MQLRISVSKSEIFDLMLEIRVAIFNICVADLDIFDL